MKRFALLITTAVFSLASASLYASDEEILQRTRIARIGSTEANSFSAEVPVVTRIQGTAFFRTSVDINNNTSQNGVTAQYQFCYTCVGAGCPAGPVNFFCTQIQTITLQGLENFHQDDFVNYLANQNLLQPGAVNGCLGTLLVTFSNLPVGIPNGSEGGVVARTYNHLDESTPSSATVGFAYNASLFFESADSTLVGTARDTKSSPGVAGTLRSNVGIHNTNINGKTAPCPASYGNVSGCVTVVLSFYDVATGKEVGTRQTLADLRPGELRQISDLWATAAIPSTVNQVIIFADVQNHSSNTPEIEGYVTIIDGGAATGGPTSGIKTQDAAFFEMKCNDPDQRCGESR